MRIGDKIVIVKLRPDANFKIGDKGTITSVFIEDEKKVGWTVNFNDGRALSVYFEEMALFDKTCPFVCPLKQNGCDSCDAYRDYMGSD